MAKENKKEEVKAIVEAVALRFNDIRYETGDKLELTESEFEILSENKLVDKRVDE